MNPQNYIMAPMVITRGPGNSERAMDIYSRMLDDRVIFMFGGVDDNMAQSIVAQLLFLDSQGQDDIHLYINSGGGVVTSGMAIIDTMNLIKSDVSTNIVGMAASMASMIANCGTPGKRFMLPNARQMIHQVSGGSQGQATDMEIVLKETLRLKKRLTEMYVEHNTKGKTYEEMYAAMERDNWFGAQEAIDFGLCDSIITNRI